MGRPKGSRNLDGVVYQEFWVKRKICIPEKELWTLNESQEMYEFCKEKVTSGQHSPMEDNASKYLKIHADQLREIGSRIYPKLKSIEQMKISAADGLTPEQKLEFLENYKQVLLQEIKNGSSPS